MDRLLQDLKLSARMLWRDRGFTTTMVLTLALCIGANAAIFAVIHGVLLKPLPYPDPGRLVAIFNAYPGAGVNRAPNGVPDYFDRLEQTTVFEELAMYRQIGLTFGGERAERITTVSATPSLFRALGAAPSRGRLFVDEDAEVGRAQKVVVGYGFWQRHLGGRDEAVGSQIRLNGRPYEIVGVLGADFEFVDPEIELWVPVAFTAADRADDRRHSNNWEQIGRLRPGATVEQAQDQIDAINAANLMRFPQMAEVLTNAGFHTTVRSFAADRVTHVRPVLYLLWGGVLTVLAIGCVNLANIASVRATGRLRELGTRHALGASFSRLARHILTESVMVAALGGLGGLAVGRLALAAAGTSVFDRLPRGEQIALDWSVVGFTAALAVAVGLLVGLVPVLALRRLNLAEVVREDGRTGTASRRTRTARRLLVTSQVAFALVLLVAAGALLASFERVLQVQPGFDASGVLTGSVSLPASRYPDAASVRAMRARLLDRVRTIPGVVNAGLTTIVPLSGDHEDSVIMADGYQAAPGESLISPNAVWVSPGYFEAMRTALVAGRFFDARDTATAGRVIIVDEQLAAKFWPGRDPLGRLMYFPGDVDTGLQPPPRDEWLTVVGVVENVRLDGLVDGPNFRTVGAYYMPLEQSGARQVTLAVRTAQDPAAIAETVRRAITAIDPELPLFDVRTMEERVHASLQDRRTPMSLALGFAAVALLLAAIGIYGVLAYQVRQRAREIGIRIALGADRGAIFGMVLREGLVILSAGTVIGLAGGWVLRQTLQAQLYQIDAMDPWVVLRVAALLVTVAAAAMLVPARKAARTDAVHVLTGA